ncbi:MAG: beta-galactosidase [Sphingomonas sp.]|nr:beta-galactosidase [Sphingomonas sp.]
MAASAPDHSTDFKAAPLSVGASWYPEQWPESAWPADLDRMEQAGFRVTRLAEFAWARIEPEDGIFDFAWLDRAIAGAAAHGMKVVLGTPTAAPPIWLTEAHPDVLRVNDDGTVERHGTRRQFSFASPTYRRYADRLVRAMAARYGHDPRVVGWQVDNEIGVPSYDEAAHRQWAVWLGKRYGSIAELNRRWSTQYWSQVYQRFDQVPLTLDREQNPALLLDVRRFQSAVWADYVGEQARTIRALADKRQFVTTNFTRWNNNFDQYAVAARLDMATWDEYVPDGRPDWVANALHHDLVRGFNQRNFWIMETQPGAVNWGKNNRSLDPGATRLLAWQAVAHGADAILYWQWRSAPGGQEQYHGTLVGADGRPSAVFPEIARTARELSGASRDLAQTSPNARVALLYSQDSRWANDVQRHAQDWDTVRVLTDWYRPFARRGVTVDVLGPGADLGRYKLVIAPALTVLPAALADRLTDWVRAGGHLVLGPRSGMKDADNALWPERQPGPLARLLGAHVSGFYALDASHRVAGEGQTGAVSTWAETLATDSADASVTARYLDGPWLKGEPVAVTRPVGKGRITYVGGLLDRTMQDTFSVQWVRQAGMGEMPVSQPEFLEVSDRLAPDGKTYRFVINHGEAPIDYVVPEGASVIIRDGIGGAVPPQGIILFALEN